jgi:hypothetical protein
MAWSIAHSLRATTLKILGKIIDREPYALGHTLEHNAYTLGMRSTKDRNTKYVTETIIHT